MEETVFLQRQGVVVTSTRIEIGAQTFATRNVGSVAVYKRGISLPAVVLILFGIGLLFSEAPPVGVMFLIGGVVWAYFSMSRRELKLVAGGGEILALKTKNPKYAELVRSAIAQAIAVR